MNRSTVFVGNIAYDVTENELRQHFEHFGHINNFRFVTDKATGKPRGFGFCEYQTEQEALMAIENLNNMDVHGRHIKVDSADGTADGTGAGPKGGRLHKNIDKTLEEIGMIEMYDIIAKMKDFIQRDYNGAKEVLTQYPVLAEALLKGSELLHALNPAATSRNLNMNMQPVPAPMGVPPPPGIWNAQQQLPMPPMQQQQVDTSQIINQVLQLTPQVRGIFKL